MPDPATLTLPSRLDAANAPQIRGEIVSLLEAGHEAIIVDCSHMTFIDSAGLYALVSGHTAMRAKHGAFVLVGLHPQASLVFDLSRVRLVITTYDTLEEARAALDES